MKGKSLLAALLSAMMIFSTAVPAFADNTEAGKNETQEQEYELYGTPDYEAPVLTSISVDKTEVVAGDSFLLTLYVNDDISGLDFAGITFINEATQKNISLEHYEYNIIDLGKNQYEIQCTVKVPNNEVSGTLKLMSVTLFDIANNHVVYTKDSTEFPLPTVAVTVTNENSEDKSAPLLKNLSISPDSIKASEEAVLKLTVLDDVSGVDYVEAEFINKATGHSIKATWNDFDSAPVIDGDIDVQVKTTEYDGAGKYDLDTVTLMDANGHISVWYSKNNPNNKPNSGIPTLQQEISFTIINDGNEDITPPILKQISIDKTKVKAPGFVTLTLDVTDDVSGYRSAIVDIVNRKEEKWIHQVHSDKDEPLKITVPISEFEVNGLFTVDSINLFDSNNNISTFYSKYHNPDSKNQLPNEIEFLVENIEDNDQTGDIITSTNSPSLVDDIRNMQEGSTAHIYYGNETTLSQEVFEAIKGQDKTISLESAGIEWVFNGRDITDENIKDIDLTTGIEAKWSSDSDAANGIDWDQNALILSFAENGKLPGKATIRIKADYVFKNEVGTENLYVYYYDNTTKEYVQVAANLTITQDEYLEFTIDHNSDFVITKGELKEKEELPHPDPDPDPNPNPDPDTNPDNKPTVPNTDSGNHTGNGSSNHSGVVNYESEKPNQNDKKAVEAYNFWQNVKNKIHKAEKGKIIKVFVPKEITNMPASVMETLRRENVGMTIKQNGKTITIPAGKAQPKQKLKAYWTFKTLDRLY